MGGPAPAAGVQSTAPADGAPAPAQGAPAPGQDGASGGAAHPLMGQPAYPLVPHPAENPDAEDKAMLGKILFWEEQLSGDGSMACGTCHIPAAGGSDPRSVAEGARLPGADGMLEPAPSPRSDDRRGSMGVVACDEMGLATGSAVQVTGRKTPSALDAMFFGELFWDGRAGRDFVDPDTGETRITGTVDAVSGEVVGGALESQAVGPPMSEVEMACASPTWSRLYGALAGATPLALARAVPADMLTFIEQHGGSYPAMFEAVFGGTLKAAEGDPDDVINATRMAFAIATYERRLTSNDTPWDRWNAGDATAMTAEQVRGFEVFMGAGQCDLCHAPPMFTDFDFHYLGFHPVDRDPGQGGLMGATDEQLGRMKTPGLRNVGLREPGGLLHQGDGPGRDLTSVLELYRSGGLREDPAIAGQIDALLVPFEMSDEDLAAMAAFLRVALTDPRAAQETAPFDRPTLGSER